MGKLRIDAIDFNADWIKTPENRRSEQVIHHRLEQRFGDGSVGIKGGPGSGHWGHAGRPGKRGGSARSSTSTFDTAKWLKMDAMDRRNAWEDLSARERDRMTDAANRIPANQAKIIAHAGPRPSLEGNDVKGAISNRMSQLLDDDGEDFVPSEDGEMISSTINEMDDWLVKSGVDPQTRYELAMEAADALVAQDRESLGRTLGDHGVHHLRGNIDTALAIIEAHPDHDPPEDIAMTYVAQVFHDTGYLTDPSRIFLDEGHARWGTQHYDANIRPLVEKALGKRAAGEISHIIRTHASTSVDWEEDVLASASRIADNLALFHKEKLPPLFRHVASTTSVLEDLSAGKINISQARSRMQSKLKSSGLSPGIQNQMERAVSEVGTLTGKFTLGMLGGSLGKVEWTGNHLVVHLRRNAEATRLQEVLDLGQRQFGKFAKTYGYDPDDFTSSLKFEFKDPRGQTLIESIIEEEKVLKRLKSLGLTPDERDEIYQSLKSVMDEFGADVVVGLIDGMFESTSCPLPASD